MDRNVLGGIVDRTTVEAGDGFVDKAGGFAICSYPKRHSCGPMQVTNNIVGGSVYAGYVGPGHACGDDKSLTFRNNHAHSIKGIKSGHGAFMHQDLSLASSSECFEVADFVGYKSYYMGFFSYTTGKKAMFKRMTLIDNQHGFGANLGNKAFEYDKTSIEFDDMKIYGESLSPDCP
jgi:hypothetical protein